MFGGSQSEGGAYYVAKSLDYALYASMRMNRMQKYEIVDEYVPVWHIVFNGYILNNAAAQTVNYPLKKAESALKVREYASRPIFYFYVLPYRGNHIGGEPYVGVHHQMVGAAFLHCQTDGTVVATAISGVVFVQILYLEPSLYVLADFLVALHVLLEFLAKSKHLVAMIYYPHLAYGRGDDRAQDGFYVQKVVVVCDYACSYHGFWSLTP